MHCYTNSSGLYNEGSESLFNGLGQALTACPWPL